MFLVMNRFKITSGFEPGFEKSWRERDSVLSQAPGFKRFALLKGPVTDAYVLYASHSVWESKSAFEYWAASDSFRKVHSQIIAPKGTYLAHPVESETFFDEVLKD
jgi:heme-degrading monooxygenase HmoA|tara:strand:+ start:888 stop:1202 length:315 start_codon:yes stop_codon:yes gene_type:complete